MRTPVLEYVRVSTLESAADTRRLAVRVASHQILAIISEVAAEVGLDMIEALIHAGVWTANTEHLLEGKGGRYAKLRDLPPDSLRRPISDAELMARLRLAPDIFAPYVERLIERGYLERVGAGLVAPSAVFTRPEMVRALEACHAGVMELTRTLERIGADAAA